MLIWFVLVLHVVCNIGSANKIACISLFVSIVGVSVCIEVEHGCVCVCEHASVFLSC